MKLLFVCQLNMVRSPIAQGLADMQGHEAYSCGITPGEPDELMMTIMHERHIDMSDHQPRSLQDYADDSFDRIVAFSSDAAAAAKAVFGKDAPIDLWNLPMPQTGSHDVRAVLETYRTLAAIIDTRLQRLKPRR
jgi:protein-tyrosine-phosphatase